MSEAELGYVNVTAQACFYDEGRRGALRGFEGGPEGGIARYVSVCENCCAGFGNNWIKGGGSNNLSSLHLRILAVGLKPKSGPQPLQPA